MSGDDLVISDKVWILVGMLLRNGQSCTPSQLSDLCHMLKFTSSEIDWLCKLPFSPLCLSQCGQVTFSQFIFHFFDIAKERYATPSMNQAVWKCYFKDCVSASSLLLPLSFSQRLYQPSLPHKLFDKEPSSDSSPANLYPQHITGESLQKPGNLQLRQYVRKRPRNMRNVTFTPPNKKRNITTTISCTVDVKKLNLHVSGRGPSSLLHSTGEEESCRISFSMDAKQCLLEDPVVLEAKEKAVSLTEHVSCYSQQSCTSTVRCIGESLAENNPDVCINLPLDTQCFMHDIARNRGWGPPNVIIEPCRTSGAKELERHGSRPVSHDPKASTVASPPKKHGNMLYKESRQKIEAECHTDRTYPGIVEDIPSFVQNSSDNLIGDCTKIARVSVHEKVATVRSNKHSPTLETSQKHAYIEGGGNNAAGLDPSGCRPSKHKGKSVKDPHHKNLNSKQVQKLRKLKKASGARKQLHTAGCSAVVEACSNQLAEVKHPSFDGFIVEAIEGSGGYGTVYKAMKKDGGKLVAIKYPFERTSCRHVQNEIKVLQKYGGHNFIPKCLEIIEESGKQCLVLDYIEHEKPEILKKEISISELKFYGFSLFKALEYLHSKGVVHRDVKPGNFLFSRNKKCGWLIDFNLAMVQLKQLNTGKYRKQAEGRLSDRLRRNDYENYHHTEASLFNLHRSSSPHHQSLVHNHTSKSKIKHMEAIHQGKASTPSGTPTRDLKFGSQGTTSPTVLQSRDQAECMSQLDRHKLQMGESGPDVSVHTFAMLPAGRMSPATGKVPALKETAMVTKKPRPNSSIHRSPLEDQGRVLQNVETQKGEQVLPRYGRRELWELVQKSQQSAQLPVSSIPSSQKKRVAAPQKRKHQKLFLDQTLPQSSALPVSKMSYIRTPTTTGHLLKARGMQKLRKEGPCAGTKGYRAPEVLLKSLFQTEKIDVWSAGVSLFQLILGKSPFSSSSNLDQSLLDIAQFCGADSICTLAKDHNRESSLSKELIELKVQPIPLSQWYEKHTKRQNIPLVPLCLFDLLEKCLQIDPTNRISAKEALQHEFFESCRDSVPPLTLNVPNVISSL